MTTAEIRRRNREEAKAAKSEGIDVRKPHNRILPTASGAKVLAIGYRLGAYDLYTSDVALMEADWHRLPESTLAKVRAGDLDLTADDIEAVHQVAARYCGVA